MKQTAVEWLFEQLEEKGDAWENVSTRRLQISIDVSDYLELKNKAKYMHKEEIINSFKNGDSNGTFETINAEQYYNETFIKD